MVVAIQVLSLTFFLTQIFYLHSSFLLKKNVLSSQFNNFSRIVFVYKKNDNFFIKYLNLSVSFCAGTKLIYQIL